MKDKVILVDCDGVLLDWLYAFDVWIKRHGFSEVECDTPVYEIGKRYNIKDAKRWIRMFNESAAIGFLPPLRDAMHYVKMLHERHGYVFHAITSLSLDPAAGALRTKNLQKLFGETAFERFVYLDTGADKDDALREYKGTGCFWVEDKPENADTGWAMGLNSLLVAHDFNVGYNGPATRVNNWAEIYNLVTGA